MRVRAQPAMKIGTQMAQMAQISQIQSVFLFIRVYNLFSGWFLCSPPGRHRQEKSRFLGMYRWLHCEKVKNRVFEHRFTPGKQDDLHEKLGFCSRVTDCAV